MTNYGILERLETDSEKLWTINCRALVDIRVAQCLKAQKPPENVFSCLVLVVDG